VPPLRAAVDAACVGVGRDPATLVRTLGIGVDQRPPSAPPTYVPGAANYLSSSVSFLTGTPEEIAEHMHSFAREGISHIQVTPRIQGVAGVEAFGRGLGLVDRR